MARRILITCRLRISGRVGDEGGEEGRGVEFSNGDLIREEDGGTEGGGEGAQVGIEFRGVVGEGGGPVWEEAGGWGVHEEEVAGAVVVELRCR